MQLTTNIIKSINEANGPFVAPVSNIVKGYFVSLDTGEYYDISSDGGGGHHAGYTDWLMSNYRLFGLSEQDAEWIKDYFTAGGPNWDEPIENNHGELVGQYYPTLIQKIKPIYKNYFRIVYLYDTANITVLDGNTDTLRKVVEFVIKNETADAYDYWVDTYDDNNIIPCATLEQLMEYAE